MQTDCGFASKNRNAITYWSLKELQEASAPPRSPRMEACRNATPLRNRTSTGSCLRSVGRLRVQIGSLAAPSPSSMAAMAPPHRQLPPYPTPPIYTCTIPSPLMRSNSQILNTHLFHRKPDQDFNAIAPPPSTIYTTSAFSSAPPSLLFSDLSEQA